MKLFYLFFYPLFQKTYILLQTKADDHKEPALTYGPFVKNEDFPNCKDCRFFVSEPFSSIQYGRCHYFGEKDLITGKIDYKYASTARQYDCGKDGKYFKQRRFFE